jgi:hypothetical protein
MNLLDNIILRRFRKIQKRRNHNLGWNFSAKFQPNQSAPFAVCPSNQRKAISIR